MLSFSNFLKEAADSKEGKNLHLDHLEDLMILRGMDGLADSIKFLKSLRNMLAGHAQTKTSKVGLTTKWDGSPAIFCGINPDNGKFFVATKGAFNVNPKLCYTPADVDELYPSTGLNPKLKLCLEYLPDLGITNVLQGDMMFSEGEVHKETIEGQRYIVFRPNTIAYAIPEDSDLAKRILAAKIGVVFHTTYRGKVFAEMNATFGADLSALKPSKTVWYRDASFTDASGAANFTEAETKQITALIAQIEATAGQLNPASVNKLASNEFLRAPLMTWNNVKIREGTEVSNIPAHIKGFIAKIDAEMSKGIIDAKKEDTKLKRTKEKTEIMHYWTDAKNQHSLVTLFHIWNLIIEAKLMLVRKLEEVQDIGTFMKTDDGYKVTKAEGFVAVDHLGTSAIKLVDRLEFSHNNFNVAKNWKK